MKSVGLRVPEKVVHPAYKRLRVMVRKVDQEIGYKLAAARERIQPAKLKT